MLNRAGCRATLFRAIVSFDVDSRPGYGALIGRHNPLSSMRAPD